MEITRVIVTLNNVASNGENKHKNDRILAFAEITLDASVVITGIRIIKGEKRIFVAMPSWETGANSVNGKTVVLWHDIVFPINKPTREYFERKILDEYYRVKDRAEKLQEAQAWTEETETPKP